MHASSGKRESNRGPGDGQPNDPGPECAFSVDSGRATVSRPCRARRRARRRRIRPGGRPRAAIVTAREGRPRQDPDGAGPVGQRGHLALAQGEERRGPEVLRRLQRPTTPDRRWLRSFNRPDSSRPVLALAAFAKGALAVDEPALLEQRGDHLPLLVVEPREERKALERVGLMGRFSRRGCAGASSDPCGDPSEAGRDSPSRAVRVRAQLVRRDALALASITTWKVRAPGSRPRRADVDERGCAAPHAGVEQEDRPQRAMGGEGQRGAKVASSGRWISSSANSGRRRSGRAARAKPFAAAAIEGGRELGAGTFSSSSAKRRVATSLAATTSSFASGIGDPAGARTARSPAAGAPGPR